MILLILWTKLGVQKSLGTACSWKHSCLTGIKQLLENQISIKVRVLRRIWRRMSRVLHYLVKSSTWKCLFPLNSLPKLCNTIEINQEMLSIVDVQFSSLDQIAALWTQFRSLSECSALIQSPAISRKLQNVAETALPLACFIPRMFGF